MSTTENKVNEAFKKVGNEFGIQTSAKFEEYRDFRIRWQRSNTWAAFQVTDYLSEAPQEVLENLARAIFEKIQGQDTTYPKTVVEWLTAPEFVDRLQLTFIKRDDRISLEEGKHKNLAESLERLKQQGLVRDDEKLKIFWSNKVPSRQGAWSSVLMKVITVNRYLDDDQVPDEVLDAVLLKEIASVECDYGMSPVEKRKTVQERMDLYPGFAGITEWLTDHRIEA